MSYTCVAAVKCGIGMTKTESGRTKGYRWISKKYYMLDL